MEKSAADLVWIVMGSALVFMMQPGFAMVESGLTRSKNSINVAVKNLTDFGVSALCFWCAGFGIMFGASFGGIAGRGFFFFNPGAMWPAVFLLFQAVFCSTSATIVSGAVAERMRFSAYIVSTIILSTLIYPIAGHWIWGGAMEGSPSGWLGKMGFIDFAGSTAVHSVGGWVSLILLILIGPRTGRFALDGSVREINGSSVPMAVLGVFLLWFGWIGFNGASTLAASDDVPGIVLRTMLGGAAGMIGSLAAGWPMSGKPAVGLILNGSLAGLVAITANCHVVSETESVIIGAAGGVVTIFASRLLTRLKIDDAVDAIPVHLAAGIWGTLAVGIFGDLDLLGTGLTRPGQIGVQALGILAVGVFCLAAGFPLLLLLNRFIPLRISLAEEAEGLNRSEHGVTTEINDLFTVMDIQAKTGNLHLRAPAEPFTEAGQIAAMYNSVLDKLQDSTVEKGEYTNILENVSDGLFLLDSFRKIGPYYSASLETILRRKGLAGIDIMELLASFLDEKNRNDAAEFFDAAFNPSIAWRSVEKLNPLKETDAHFDEGGNFLVRRLEFTFTRLEEGKKIGRLLAVVRDNTERKELAEEIEKTKTRNREEMEMLQRILHIEPAELADFLAGVKEDVDAINEELRSGGENREERLNAIFRYSHAIKGDSQLLSLDFLAARAEDLEAQIQQIRTGAVAAKRAIQGEDFLPITLACSRLMEEVRKLDGIAAKWLKLSGGISAQGGGLAKSLQGLAERLAARYAKQAALEMSGMESLSLESGRRRALKDVLVQLVRNSVYHGIETPKDRRKAGKKEMGLISITGQREGNQFRIVYRDDGAGINTESVMRKARAAGLVPQGSALSEAEQYRLLFHPGFSTAGAADDVAGKGMGLSLVRQRLKELGAKLSVKSGRGRFCEFSIVIPLKESETL